MKQGKHSKKINDSRLKEKGYESYSNNDIVSRTPKGKIVLDIISKLLFVIGLITVVFAIITIVLLGKGLEEMPKTFIVIIIALVLITGILAGIQMSLLSGKKGRKIKRKRIASIVISLLVIITSTLGGVAVNYGNNALKQILEGGIWAEEGSNKDQVAKISKEPFIVYVSGVDTRNSPEIKDKALSDVNMIVAVNPQQKRVLMVSVPRDYYLPLDGDPNKMDKLTHAGNYGVECSMKTLSSYFGIKFNYYVRVNFKSVYDIVNAVGGITVKSEYDFSSRYSYTGTRYYYKKGTNNLNGDQALAFARERKSFSAGDRQRGIHQQLVIEATANKIASASVLLNNSKLESVLKAINSNIKSNFSQKEIKSLISREIDTIDEKWSFESMSVDGTGDTRQAYSTGSYWVYVMQPKVETVQEAKAAVDAVMAGNPLPSDKTSSTQSSPNN